MSWIISEGLDRLTQSETGSYFGGVREGGAERFAHTNHTYQARGIEQRTRRRGGEEEAEEADDGREGESPTAVCVSFRDVLHCFAYFSAARCYAE